MKSKFSNTWKRSTQPRKQRKYRYNAPLHIRQKLIGVHLSKELRQKHKRRTAGLRKGDKVKVLRGQFKGKTGKVERIDLKKLKVYIMGIESVKKEGTKEYIPIEPSNLLVTEFNLEDKKRRAKLQE